MILGDPIHHKITARINNTWRLMAHEISNDLYYKVDKLIGRTSLISVANGIR